MLPEKKSRPARASTLRRGGTAKVSISLDQRDLLALRRRAKKVHGGNLSAAIAEGARRICEEEGREALVAWLGPAAATTTEERAAILAEWYPARPRRRRGRAA
jgi:hypothetical protein